MPLGRATVSAAVVVAGSIVLFSPQTMQLVLLGLEQVEQQHLPIIPWAQAAGAAHQ
jgi:hypothetical protein